MKISACRLLKFIMRSLGMLAGLGAILALDLPARADDATLPPTGPVQAVVPARWTPPAGTSGTIDYALSAQADAWLRHVVLGDPSFDSFRHAPNNPVVRGEPPFEWPVNGSLFRDPQSGHWYLYVGYYHTGYAASTESGLMRCGVFRSTDQGRSWQKLGPIFAAESFRFEGDQVAADQVPDVMVQYADGRYWMCYDWVTNNFTWDQSMHPTNGSDGGDGLAWAERPEGPFRRLAKPVIRTSQTRGRYPLSEYYSRPYAASVVRRANDWLVFTSVDSSAAFSWAVLAMTAPTPEGPWSKPVMILSVEGDRYHPQIVETFPQFVHDGYVYAPNTSVAKNRNFQVIYRAKLEEAHRPEAWELYQNGTAWHADFVPHEAAGIWGQTFSGFVDPAGDFRVMFPSRDAENRGTINLATRPWNQPLRERGFVFSAHGGGSLTLLRAAYRGFSLESSFTLRGQEGRIVWGYRAPLGANTHAADATLHALCRTSHYALALKDQTWRVVSVDAKGQETVVANGALQGGDARQVGLAVAGSGEVQLTLDGQSSWKGQLPSSAGPIGLLLEPNTTMSVDRFAVTGRAEPAVFSLLCVDGISAGVQSSDWKIVTSPHYRFGIGAVREAAGGRVKWNFRGRGFRLWLPKGPDYGVCEILLDGRKLGEVDLKASEPQLSQAVFTCSDGGDGYHAVVVRSTGRFAADSLDVLN